MATSNSCVAWIDTMSVEPLDSQMSFYDEAANMFGFELISFYGDDGNKGMEFMLNEILDKGIKTIITKSITSLCRNLDSGIDIARKIFQNKIAIVEVAYNMQDEWSDHSFNEILSNNIEYAELLRMDESVH